MFINEIIQTIKEHCFKEGYTWIPTFDCIKGAGTFNFNMIDNMLKNKHFKFISEEWSYRAHDSIKTINTDFCLRLGRHLQLQIVDFPGNKDNMIKLAKSILSSIGITEPEYIIQLKENNWKHETLGALGKGYELLVCGLEVAQLTTFEYMCGTKVCGGQEIAIGIERLSMIKQEVNSVFKLQWDKNFKYKDLFLLQEQEMLKEKEILTLDICKEIFDKTLENIKFYIKNNLNFLAFKQFGYLNHILGILEEKDVKLAIQKRQNIDELKHLSITIWNNIRQREQDSNL